jgi:2-iminobutanoate/2-iminopropanoate deaminase
MSVYQSSTHEHQKNKYNLWSAVNTVYAKFMGEHRPARAVVPTGELHYGFLIEIEAIAATND